jgi:hypothetical protein
VGTVLDEVTRHAPEGREAKDTLGRVGLVGKGVVYGVVGLLALQLALGDPAADTSTGGAIEWVAQQPFGRFLLVALTLALFALGLWQLLNAAVGDPAEGDESGLDRLKSAGKGVFYLALAVAALSATVANWSGSGDGGAGGGGGEEQQAAGVLLGWPAGRWLVVAIGLAVIGYAVYAFKEHAVDQAFCDRLEVGERHWVAPFGRAGYGARSVVYVLIGLFFVEAGLTHDPEQAEGMSAALADLAAGGWTRILLWVVAFGFLAYGAFSMAEARFRRAA